MGKASAPASPDYTPIAQADEQQSQEEFQLGEQQLAWGQQQFNETWPAAQQYMNQQTQSSAQETAFAGEQEQQYQNTYVPMMNNFASTAANYDTPGRAQQQAGQAEADVSNTFDAQKQGALSNLESYGIDPSQTRYAALDLGTSISQAAATAAAGTQSYINTENTGLALQGSAIAMGQGLPGNVASGLSTAAGAGSAGITAANQTTSTGVNSMGTPGSYFGGASNANSGATSAMSTGFNNEMAGANFNAQQSSNFSSGVGELAGMAAAIAIM